MRVAILCFTTSPLMWVLWDQRHVLGGFLTEPSFDGRFIVVCAIAGFVMACAVALLTFVLEALPGAPFRHIDIDNNGVTIRRWLFTQRILHRDIDGWGVLERELRTRSADWPPIRWREYSVVAGHGVGGGKRVHPARDFATTLSATAFTPPAESGEQFAGLLAGFLSDCKSLRGQRAVADVPEPLASQTFALHPISARPPKHSHPRKPRTRTPGRFPTNEDMAEHWSGQAIQAMRAADDLPAFDDAATRADLHAQLARRDRKRRAREKREAGERRRNDRSSGSSAGSPKG